MQLKKKAIVPLKTIIKCSGGKGRESEKERVRERGNQLDFPSIAKKTPILYECMTENLKHIESQGFA